MSNVVTEFIKARRELYKELSIDDGYYVDFKFNVPWALCGEDDVRWFEEGDEFGADIVNKDITVGEIYTSILIDNGCGDTLYTVFENKDRNYEYE